MDVILEPRIWIVLRLEGLAMALTGIAGAWLFSAEWWQVAVFALLPDLSMAGYIMGARIGALLYNIAHTYLVPVILAAFTWSLEPSLFPVACIWLAHIGVDRALGYGLKSETSFHDTHLCQIGAGRMN